MFQHWQGVRRVSVGTHSMGTAATAAPAPRRQGSRPARGPGVRQRERVFEFQSCPWIRSSVPSSINIWPSAQPWKFALCSLADRSAALAALTW